MMSDVSKVLLAGLLLGLPVAAYVTGTVVGPPDRSVNGSPTAPASPNSATSRIPSTQGPSSGPAVGTSASLGTGDASGRDGRRSVRPTEDGADARTPGTEPRARQRQPAPETSNAPGSTPTATPTDGDTETPGATPTATPTDGATETPGATPTATPTDGTTEAPSDTSSSE